MAPADDHVPLEVVGGGAAVVGGGEAVLLLQRHAAEGHPLAGVAAADQRAGAVRVGVAVALQQAALARAAVVAARALLGSVILNGG